MLDLFVQECMRVLEDHRVSFHAVDKNDCKICRSLRRAIIGGLYK